MNQIIDLNPDYAPEDSAVALGLVDKTTFLPVGDLHKRETYSCHGLEAAIASEIEVSQSLRMDPKVEISYLLFATNSRKASPI